MNVANASFSQMPFHQRIVTRSPNHMCASSCAIDVGDRGELGLGRLVGVDEQEALAVGDAAEVLHRALREVRERDHVHLRVRGTGCRSSRRRTAGRTRRPRPRTPLRCPFPGRCTIRSGTPSTSTGSVASSGPTTNATRYVDIGIVSANRTRTRPSPAGRRAPTSGPFEIASRPSSHHERDAEHGLQVGLVPARERAARVGGLELRGRDRARAARLVRRRSSGRSRASGPRASRGTPGAASTPPAPPSPTRRRWARSVSGSRRIVGDLDACRRGPRATRVRRPARRRSARSRRPARGSRPARPRTRRTSRPRGRARGRGRSGAGRRCGAAGTASSSSRFDGRSVTRSVVHVGEPARRTSRSRPWSPRRTPPAAPS